MAAIPPEDLEIDDYGSASDRRRPAGGTSWPRTTDGAGTGADPDVDDWVSRRRAVDRGPERPVADRDVRHRCADREHIV